MAFQPKRFVHIVFAIILISTVNGFTHPDRKLRSAACKPEQKTTTPVMTEVPTTTMPPVSTETNKDGAKTEEPSSPETATPASETPKMTPCAKSKTTAPVMTDSPQTDTPVATTTVEKEKETMPPKSEAPSATTAPGPVSGKTSMLREMLKVVNAKRKENNKSPLCYNKKLITAAQKHSDDQASMKRMSHTGSNGSSAGDRIKAAGFNGNSYGENVAYNQQNVEAVMKAWMNSPGHRRNILGDFKFFGAGETDLYWTQKFGSSNGEECATI